MKYTFDKADANLFGVDEAIFISILIKKMEEDGIDPMGDEFFHWDQGTYAREFGFLKSTIFIKLVSVGVLVCDCLPKSVGYLLRFSKRYKQECLSGRVK
jgi:hypothetical protein